jgi:adenosylcobinamide-phosphate synthase
VAILLAVLVDLLAGDPPNRWHPTAWMGRFIGFAGRRRPRGAPAAELACGGLVVLAGATLAAGAGAVLARLIARLPAPADRIATALVLKTTISLRGLDRAAADVQAALERDDLPGARRWLSWHLVSRETSQLTGEQVAAATIESLAENASDGVVAPLLAFAIGGLPLALAYRFVNTADAMLGYRDPDREWYGKVAARLDDACNVVPARVTGALIVAAAAVAGGSPAGAWRTMRRDGGRTASPNAGVPMSAMAGALSVRLEKVGHYDLGAGLRAPVAADVGRARRVLAATAALGVPLLAGLARARR